MARRLTYEEALDALQHGAVVAVATDTVYGLGASLAHPSAVAALFALKGRPSTLALPVLVSAVAQIGELGVAWPEPAEQLRRAFWPGPLTIVVAVEPPLAALLGSAQSSVGFRQFDEPLLARLIGASGPLAVTSANRHGAPPCTSAADVLTAFDARDELAGVLDAGPRSSAVSTVVDLTGATWRLVREGAIGRAALTEILG